METVCGRLLSGLHSYAVARMRPHVMFGYVWWDSCAHTTSI